MLSDAGSNPATSTRLQRPRKGVLHAISSVARTAGRALSTNSVPRATREERYVTSLAPAVMVALIGGLAISLQSLFSGTIGHRVGVAESTFIVHVGGVLLAGLIMLGLRGGNLSQWRAVPWYTLTAGLLGVAIVASVSFSVPRLGLASTLTLAILAQLLLGALLDHFGLLGAVPRPLDLWRITGLTAVALGTWLVVR